MKRSISEQNLGSTLSVVQFNPDENCKSSFRQFVMLRSESALRADFAVDCKILGYIRGIELHYYWPDSIVIFSIALGNKFAGLLAA